MISSLISVFFWQSVIGSEGGDISDEVKNNLQQEILEKKWWIPKSPKQKNREFYLELVKEKTTEPCETTDLKIDKRIQPKQKSNNSGTNTVIVIAPHPDDEILCCYDEISRKISEGKDIKFIFVTDGDAKSLTSTNTSKMYGRTRRLESIAAAKELGLDKTDLFFLGFPDGFLTELIKGNKEITSTYTGLNKTPKGSYKENVRYFRENLKNLLKDLIVQFNPEEIFLPAQKYETHPDHIAVGKLSHEVMREITKNTPEIYTYVVHGRKLNDKKVFNSKKLQTINIFQSQFHTKDHYNFMRNFACYDEVFFDENSNKKISPIVQTETHTQ